MALNRKYRKLYKPYLQELRNKSVRKFHSREEVAEFLYDDVFRFDEFKNNVQEVSTLQEVSYTVAHDIITNHLIDILYEIDKSQASNSNIRILILRYMKIEVRFAIGVENSIYLLKKFLTIN